MSKPSPYEQPEMWSSVAGIIRHRDQVADILGRNTAQVPAADREALLAVLLTARSLMRRGRRPSDQALTVTSRDGTIRLDGLVFAEREQELIVMAVGYGQLDRLIADLEAL